jgi:hypothetical protein
MRSQEMHRIACVAAAIALLAPQGAWAVTWEEVSREYGACADQMGAVRQEAEVYASGLRRTEAVRTFAEEADVRAFDRFLDGGRQKQQTFRRKIGRLDNLLERVGVDIEKERKKGGPCPECIGEAVSLVSRAAEDLREQIAAEKDSLTRFLGAVTRLRDPGSLLEASRGRVAAAAEACEGAAPGDPRVESLTRAREAQARAEETLAQGQQATAIRYALQAYEIADLLAQPRSGPKQGR